MPPSTFLPARPNLEHLRNQAKDLLRAYRSGEPSAISRFRECLPVTPCSQTTTCADCRYHSATPSV